MLFDLIALVPEVLRSPIQCPLILSPGLIYEVLGSPIQCSFSICPDLVPEIFGVTHSVPYLLDLIPEADKKPPTFPRLGTVSVQGHQCQLGVPYIRDWGWGVIELFYRTISWEVR